MGFLAALLEKTGTSEDLALVQKRKGGARQREAEMRRLEEEAMEKGHIWTEPIVSEAPDQPTWAPILVIVPPSVLEHWERDFATWGHFGVSSYQGEERHRALHEIKYGGAEIMLVAKSMLMRDNNFLPLLEVKWKLIIIDEFHNFKNVKGILSKNLRKLRDEHNAIVVGLTGTLIQNDHEEFW